MITDTTYKSNVGEIAELFCADQSNKVLCVSSLKRRLISLLTDDTFGNAFLPYLDQGRFYVQHFSNFKRINATNWEVDATFYDLITNQRIAGTWVFTTRPDEPKAALKNLLLSYGFNIVQGVYPYTDVTLTDQRIVHKPSKTPGYGIVYVPQTASGSGGGGSGGFAPGKIVNVQGKPLEPVEVSAGLFGDIDVKAFLIPAGILAAVYFLIG